MKKISCVIILLCLLIDITGSGLMFGVYRQAVKASMQSAIQYTAEKNDEFNFIITSGNAALFQQEDEDELSYQGVMYDISQKKQTADTLYITCLMDNDETALVDNYGNACFNKIQQKNNNTVPTYHLFYSFYEPIHLNSSFFSPILLQKLILPPSDNRIYKTLFTVITPPPKAFT